MTALAILLIWSVAAGLVFRLMSVWDQLPPRVAVHFGMALQPNGWSSRAAMAAMVMLFSLGHAALATWLIVGFGGQIAMMAPIQLVAAGVLASVFWQMIQFNIEGKPLRPVRVVAPVLLLLFLVGASLLRMFHHPAH